MPELSLLEIIKYVIKTLLSSKVFTLLLLEVAVLIVAMIFSRLMNKKVVKISSTVASLIVLALYISNYVHTLIIFMNNVSTKLVEMIYFPTTLEFMIVMIISFVIMAVTLISKKSNKVVKIVNTVFPILISFLFLSIIEYINVNNVPFDEFSVFTNPILMSLYEFAMALFITWLIGLLVYKIDLFIIASINEKEEVEKVDLVTVHIPEEKVEEEAEIELPKLKNGVIK